MMKKTLLSFIAAGFLLAAQPAGAFDAGSWFTGRIAAPDEGLSQTQMTARSSGGQRHSSSLQQLVEHFKKQNQSKKQHSRR